MRTRDFGGFSTRTCSIDLRFLEPRHFDHFVEAWSRSGPPSLERCTFDERAELVSVGTTLEHELRHYHDFLLGYAPLHNYWLRLQAMLNANPIIMRMLSSDADKLVFPVVEWAQMRRQERTAYLVDALSDISAASGVWDPPVLEGPRPTLAEPHPAGMDPKVEEHVLHLLRDQLVTMERVRSGIRSPLFPFPLTPRFASELSSFLVQCASVLQTYGVAERDLFMNRLAADGSLYAKFFCRMVAIFSGKGLPRGIAPVVIDADDVDWRALSVAATWCFCGSVEQPELLTTAQRLARVIEAALLDRNGAFPPFLGAAALLDHVDSYFGVEPATAAARRNTEALRGFVARAEKKIAPLRAISPHPETFLRMFESLVAERERLVDRIFGDPEGYLNLDRYVRELPWWPQCPVSLDFRPAGICVFKSVLARLGEDPRFTPTYDEEGRLLEDAVVQVFYPSFLPGGTAFPLDDALELANARDLFDLFFDPHQVDVEMEGTIRRLLKTDWGKTLVRLINPCVSSGA